MLPKILLSVSILFLISCKQKIEGIILDKSTKTPMDGVAVSEHSIILNSYPYPYQQSNRYGFFSFTKESRNLILYFWKEGYTELRVEFDNDHISKTSRDTIYLIKKE